MSPAQVNATKSKPVVVFDDVRPHQAPIVLLRSWLGYRIVKRPCSTGLRAQRWQDRLEKAGCLSHLHLSAWPYRNFNPAMGRALETTERFYSEQWSTHPVIAAAETLYGDPRVHIAFKKSLCEDLRRHYEYELWCEALRACLGEPGSWRYIPLQPEDAFPVLAGEPRNHWAAQLTLGARARGRLRQWRERIKWTVGPLGLVLAAAIEPLRGIFKQQSYDSFEYGVAVVSPHREFANSVRGPGFLLDDERIRKDNTLFVSLAPLSKGEQALMTERGLQWEDGSGTLAFRSWWEALVVAGRILKHGWFAPTWLSRAGTYLVAEYLRWSGLSTRYRLKHFISYADYGLRAIPRNILLNKAGACTWHYSDAEGVFDTMPGPLYRDRLFGYMLFDRWVTWSGRFARLLQRHHQSIGEYVIVGNLWSEHVRMIRERKIHSDLPDHLVRAGWRPGFKIVAVFDSGLADESIITYADGLAFARDIARLVADEANIFLVWKEKKTWQQHLDWGGRELIGVFETLKQHPRCFFPGSATPSAEVMAICDLCIGFPYGSPVTEALGAGVKAIYHDADKKYAGGYYDRVPGLVTHDYDALCKRVGELLGHTTDVQYQDYLKTYVKGDIDPFLDGRALSRFRDLLTAGTS